MQMEKTLQKKVQAKNGTNIIQDFPLDIKVKANAYLFVLHSNSSFNGFCKGKEFLSQYVLLLVTYQMLLSI